VQEGADGRKISFSLGAWFSCDEQKDRQEGIFFNLDSSEGKEVRFQKQQCDSS